MPDNALRVCFIAGTLGLGGAERQLYYMLKALTDNGAICQVLCLTQGETYESRIQALGVPVIYVGQQSNRLLRLVHIVREVRRFRPTIIQSAHSYTSLYAFAAGRLTGCKAVGAVRTEGVGEFERIGMMGKATLRLGHTFIGNSQAALNTLSAVRPGSRRYLLPNAIDTQQFQPSGTPQTAAGSPAQLLTVGRLIQQKRHDILLQVAALLRDTGQNFHLTLVGDGPLRATLEAQAADLGLQGRVTFAGSTENVLPYYHASHILLLTSDYEGTPNVVIEGLACGLPVVATRAGGTVDLVTDGVNGFLVNCGDYEKLAHYSRHLIKDAALRQQMGAAGRDHIIQQYSLNALYDRLMDIYQQVGIKP